MYGNNWIFFHVSILVDRPETKNNSVSFSTMFYSNGQCWTHLVHNVSQSKRLFVQKKYMIFCKLIAVIHWTDVICRFSLWILFYLQFRLCQFDHLSVFENSDDFVLYFYVFVSNKNIEKTTHHSICMYLSMTAWNPWCIFMKKETKKLKSSSSKKNSKKTRTTNDSNRRLKSRRGDRCRYYGLWDITRWKVEMGLTMRQRKDTNITSVTIFLHQVINRSVSFPATQPYIDRTAVARLLYTPRCVCLIRYKTTRTNWYVFFLAFGLCAVFVLFLFHFISFHEHRKCMYSL